ncbi:MAG: patatin-like phospholipase family protein, partial [Propionicimonas sp.]
MSSFELTDPASYAAPPLECDLVMKGGITSGLVYPKAAARLATRYRFRSVGGASAGAIAAGLTAAAEYRRQHSGDGEAQAGAGFAKLVTIPQVLGTKLSTLFLPSVPLAPSYQALTAWIEPGWGTARKLRATLAKVVSGAPLVVVGVTLALLVPGLLVALAVQGWAVDAAGWGRALWS